MVNADFRDLFAALNDAGARYLVVGAHAVAFYAEPRFTKDLDVWVEASPTNAPRLMAALHAFGAPTTGVTEAAGDHAPDRSGAEPHRSHDTHRRRGIRVGVAEPGAVHVRRSADLAHWATGPRDEQAGSGETSGSAGSRAACAA